MSRARAAAALDAVDAWAQFDPGSLSPAAKTEMLRSLETLGAKTAALRLRLLAVADDAAHAAGHRDTAAWHAHVTRTDVGVARAAHRTARGLVTSPAVAHALSAGHLGEHQASSILQALERLPEVPARLRAAAERRLVEHARSQTARQLVARGKGILDEVDPSGAGRHLGTTLADEAGRAWARTRLTLRDRHDGTTDLVGTVPTPVAVRLRTLLHAFTSPRAMHRDQESSRAEAPGVVREGRGAMREGHGARRSAVQGGTSGGSAGAAAVAPPSPSLAPYPTRAGQALCSLLEGLDPATLPRHGGAATTVIVTIDHRELVEALGTGSMLGDATPISAGEVRRLACGAGLVPAVLGARSQVLDLGRRTRLFTPAQVVALRLRDRECRAAGCTVPAAWCEAHHLRPWSRGGSTDLANGLLLCSFHHHLIHDPTWRHERGTGGEIRFHQASGPDPGVRQARVAPRPALTRQADP